MKCPQSQNHWHLTRCLSDGATVRRGARVLLIVFLGFAAPFPFLHAADAESAKAQPLDADLYWQCRDVLRGALDATEFWPSMHAAQALTEAGIGEVVRFRLAPRLPTEKDGNRRCGLGRELVRAGDPAKAAVLVKVLTDPASTADERIHAAESLYKVNAGNRAEAHLRKSLDAGDPVLELMAAAALVRAGHADVLPRIRARLHDADPKIFRIAAWLAGRFGDTAAVPALQRLLPVKCDALTHSFVINALARLGDADARREVIANLKSADAAVRTYAATALGSYGTPADSRVLRPLLDDRNLDARIRAAQAILRLMDRQLAADRDRDGLPDAIELELGTPQPVPEPFVVVWHDAAREVPANTDPEKTAAHPVEIRFCHAGADRFVWQVRFDRPFSGLRTVFHMYMDLDDNRANGRQDRDWARGVDVMYTFSNARLGPRFFTPSLRTHSDWPVRGMILKDSLWLCDDVRVRIENGKTRFRMWTLSEYRNTAGKVVSRFSTPAQTVEAPLHPARTVPDLPIPKNEGVQVFPPSWELRHDLQFAPGTLELDARDAQCTDVELQGNGAADLAGHGAGVVALTVASSGKHYVAAYVRALSGGLGAVEMRKNGSRAATFAAGSVEPPGTLLATTKPIIFHVGDRLEFRALPRSGRVRLRQVLLVSNAPKWPALRIGHVTSAVLPPSSESVRDRVVLAWTTNRPAICELRDEGVQTQKPVRVVVDTEPAEVHRFVVPDAWSQSTDSLRVSLIARDTLGGTAKAGPLKLPLRRPQPAGADAWPSRRIALTVTEPTAYPRKAWPVRSGVPLPPKTLAAPVRCRVLDAAGRIVPAQFRALSTWPDGSVKWLLLDFLAETKPAGADSATARYTLETNVTPPPAGGGPKVSVRETADGVLVDTGVLRVRMRRDRFDPFEAVEIDGRRAAATAGRGLRVVANDGDEYTSRLAKPDQVLVEAAGPIRATVCVRGHVANAKGRRGIAYLCRLDFFAGRRAVRCTMSLDNDFVTRKMSLFREAVFHIPTTVVRAAVFGGDKGAMPRSPQLPARLLQDYDNRWRLTSSEPGGVLKAGKRAAGVVAAGNVAVAVRDFWQLYPKALAATPDGLAVELLPKLPEDQYTSEANRKLLDRLYCWCDKGQYKLRAGVRISTVFFVNFGKASAPDALAAHAQNPLFAACIPQWYCASKVMGPLVPRKPGQFPTFEANSDKAFAGFLARREKVREYGFLNFGDWYGEREWNWGNIEYDTPGALALGFLRTGRLDLLRRGEQAEAHNADVDTIHYDANPRNIGRVHIHCLGHTGGYFPAGFKGMAGSFTDGAMTPSHTWDRGHFLFWALTGEPRFRETGDRVAGHLASVDAGKSYIGRSRSGGWALIALTGAYQVTGDPYYLTAARVLTRKILNKQRPNGQWRHAIWEARDVTPQPWGCKPFMTGIILHGLCMMDRIEPSDGVEAAIRRGAGYLWAKTYLRKDHGFVYAEAPRFMNRGGIWTLPLVGDGLAYACRLDPERRDRSLLLDACSWNFHKAGISSFGKSFTQGICFMPYMLPQLLELGISNVPPPVEPDVLLLRKAVVLPVGGRCELRIRIERKQSAPADWVAEFAPGAERWLDLPANRSLRWRATQGVTASPALRVRAPNAPGRDTVTVTLRSGDRIERLPVLFEAVTPRKPGARIGWITGKDDWLRRAVEACGEKIETVPDLRTADLTPYHTLVAGAEAFEKSYAHCRDAYVKLLEFTARGGRLVCGQLNDAHWRLEFLPFDLVLSDANSTSGPIATPDHPLFGQPVRLTGLPAAVCYDTIVAAAPEWRVLARDASGNPAMVEAAVGAGRALVMIPSFDRLVVNETAEADVRTACRTFIRNLAAYLHRGP